MFDVHHPSFDRWCAQRRIDPHRKRRFRNAFYKKAEQGVHAAQTWLGEIGDDVSFHSLHLESRHDSKIDGASKLVFRTASSRLVESVILRTATGRTALCVSSQIGCAARCQFCATGSLGLQENLSASEILDQVVQANRLLAEEKRRVRNVVFMGMGEPFHNEDALYEALELLQSPAHFELSPRHLVVSSVGIPKGMLRCAKTFPRVRLALSLHAANQGVRDGLMPYAARHTLRELRETLEEIHGLQEGRPVMVEYLLFEGFNDRDQDARDLIDYLRGLSVHINLIPFNPVSVAPHLRATPRERREEFGRILKSEGFPVTLRYSLGADIEAACGQLVRDSNEKPSQPQ